MRRSHHSIYRSRFHVAVTLFFVALPPVFLFLFSRATNVDTAQLFSGLGLSLFRLIIAYIFAMLFGWFAAVSFYQGRRAVVALPVFDVLQSFPTFAALPLATLFWGKTNFTVIFFLVITIIWPIFFSIISSLKLIRSDWREAAQIYGLSGWQYFKKFLLPITIPGVVTGSIIGLGEGWEALIATEIIVGMRSGLGIFFENYSTNVTVTAFGVLGFLLLIFSINKIIWLPLLEWSHAKVEE